MSPRSWLLSSLLLIAPLVQGEHLMFAFAEDEAPLSYREDGLVRGSIPAVTRLVFEFLPQHELEMMTVPWPRAQRMVKSGEAEGFVTYPSRERRQYAHFTSRAAYSIDYGYLIYHRENAKRAELEAARSFEDLRGLTFIGQNGAGWERDNIPGFMDTEMANGLDAMMHLLMRRRVGDFIVMPPEQAIFLAKQHGYRPDLLYRRVDFIPNAVIPFHVGISVEVPDSRRMIEAADEVIQSDDFLVQRERLINQYRE